MKKIFLYSLGFASLLLSTACTDELPEANFELPQVDKLTATAGDMQVALNWTPMEGAAPTEYYLSWTSATIGVDGGNMTLESSASSITVKELTNDVKYTFSIQPRYAKGLSGKVSATVTPKSERFPVTNFKAAAGDTQVRLRWTKPASDKLLSYSLHVMPGDKTIPISDKTAEAYVAEGLTNGQEYTFALTCIYTIGKSNEVSASATPGEVSPITVDAEKYVLNNVYTFKPNEMYFTLGTIASASWNLGNGMTSTKLAPTVVYTSTGKVMVTVTVTYTDSSTESGSMELDVTDYLWASSRLTKGSLTEGYVKVSNPVFSPDLRTMYIPTSGTALNGNLYAIDLVTGVIKWAFEMEQTYGGGALVGPDGTIYQATSSTAQLLIAINPDGTKKWQVALDKIVGASLSISADGSVLYCISNSATIYAVNTASGSVAWQKIAGGVTATGSAVAARKVGGVFAATQSGVFAYDASGTALWSRTDLSATERGAIAFNADGSNMYVALRAGKGVIALKTSDGTDIWRAAATSGDAYFPIVDKNENVYFTEKNTKLVYGINADGTQKWTFDVGANMIYCGLTLSEAGVVYGSTQAKAADGSYKVFGITTTGIKAKEWDQEEQMMCSLSIGPDKRLYVGTINTTVLAGSIFGYEIGQGLQAGAWAVRGGDLQGTSRQR